MAYTTKKVWAVGDILTAADMNTYVGDNIAQIAAVPLILVPQAAVLPPTNAPTIAFTNSGSAFYELKYADAANTSCFWTMIVPDNLAGNGTIDFDIIWRTPTAVASETARWEIKTAASAMSNPYNPATVSRGTVDSDAKGTTNHLIKATVTWVVPGLIAGDLFIVELLRQGTHANDDLTDDAYLRMMTVVLNPI